MTYNEFLNSLSYGCTLFFDTFNKVVNMMSHNYIFITIFGSAVFCFIILYLHSFIGELLDMREQQIFPDDYSKNYILYNNSHKTSNFNYGNNARFYSDRDDNAPLPEWIDKNLTKREMSDVEKKEIDELLEGFE